MASVVVVGFCDGAQYIQQYLKGAFQAAAQASGVRVSFQVEPRSNPDLLVHSLFGSSHKRYTCPKVLWSGEPDDVSGRLGISLLLDCKNLGRLRPSGIPFQYLPFYAASFAERSQNRPSDLVKPASVSLDLLGQSKTKFCAFLYSHDVDFRNRLFDTISRYRRVDAIGRCRNNTGTTPDRGAQNYNDSAVRQYRPYKFV